MNQPVQKICDSLKAYKLIPSERIAEMQTRWQSDGGAAEDAESFGKWLVTQGELTEFQRDFLMRGVAQKLCFNDHLLLDRVGQGAFAGIYRARSGDGQTVAIKVLPASKAKIPEILTRFQREARLAVRFSHQNVVRTFDVDEAHGLHYIVMEFLDGETLEDVLKRRRRLSARETVRLAQQVLAGLQELHEHDVVHRDLKPANLMLVPASAQEADSILHATLKILDVGLGRALFDEGAEGQPGQPAELTAAGDLLGNALYMSPEQARDARKADVRSDLYSIGCVLYEVLAGRPPYMDKNVMRILLQHASAKATPLCELNADVPASLQSVIDRMIEKDPARRYPTPQDVLRDLNSIDLSTLSQSVTPPPPMTEMPAPDKPPSANPLSAAPRTQEMPVEAKSQPDTEKPIFDFPASEVSSQNTGAVDVASGLSPRVAKSRLVVTRGKLSAPSFPLEPFDTIVGREEGCHVVVPDPSVSRKHCRFTWEQGTLYVEDLGSANGTLINGSKLTSRHALTLGDVIQVGAVYLQVVFGDAEPTARKSRQRFSEPDPAEATLQLSPRAKKPIVNDDDDNDSAPYRVLPNRKKREQ